MLRKTKAGTVYFTSPEVAMISKPTDAIQTRRVSQFLAGLGEETKEYLYDSRHELTDAEVIMKFCGQLDYLSFGPNRTKNMDAQKYFDRIKSEAHGSILEHANFGFLVWGISRSCSHEIVRHRAGFAYSQTSQRYVTNVRFVERLELQMDVLQHGMFEDRIDEMYTLYKGQLVSLNQTTPTIEGESKTERLKRIRQTARSVLPNETETSMVITANVRAWRHFLEMRANPHAETEIRQLAMEIYYLLLAEAPMLFNDYQQEDLADDTIALTTDMRKV